MSSVSASTVDRSRATAVLRRRRRSAAASVSTMPATSVAIQSKGPSSRARARSAAAQLAARERHVQRGTDREPARRGQQLGIVGGRRAQTLVPAAQRVQHQQLEIAHLQRVRRRQQAGAAGAVQALGEPGQALLAGSPDS